MRLAPELAVELFEHVVDRGAVGLGRVAAEGEAEGVSVFVAACAFGSGPASVGRAQFALDADTVLFREISGKLIGMLDRQGQAIRCILSQREARLLQ